MKIIDLIIETLKKEIKKKDISSDQKRKALKSLNKMRDDIKYRNKVGLTLSNPAYQVNSELEINIDNCFIWEQTDEGVGFWSTINDN